MPGQDLILSANDTAQIASGQDSQIASGGQARIHTGQAIGILAGAIQAGGEAAGKGLSIIAAQGGIDLQAQAGPAQIASKAALEIKSANGAINFASAKKVTLAVSGGASITIEGGSFTAQCPGKISVKAGKKSMVGGGSASWSMPAMPRSTIPVKELKFDMRLTDVPGPAGHALANTPWKIVKSTEVPKGMGVILPSAVLLSGETDAKGLVLLSEAEQQILAKAYQHNPNSLWLLYPGQAVQISAQVQDPTWSEETKLLHALNAADFSGDSHPHSKNSDAVEDINHAKTTLDARNTASLMSKL